MSLRALDHHVISDEEIIENLQVSSRFKSLTPNFRLQLYHSSPKVSTDCMHIQTSPVPSEVLMTKIQPYVACSLRAPPSRRS